MQVARTSKLVAFALALAFACAGSASAQNAPADGQTPPADSQKAEPRPVPDKGTTSQLACIEDETGGKGSGKSRAFVVTLKNKCAVRMHCRVFVNAVHSKGSTLGHATLVLGPKSAGAAAQKSYAMKVPSSGGMTTMTQECRVL